MTTNHDTDVGPAVAPPVPLADRRVRTIGLTGQAPCLACLAGHDDGHAHTDPATRTSTAAGKK